MKKFLTIALMAAVVLAGCKKEIKIIAEPTAPTVELTEGNIPADTKLTVKATVTEGAKLTYQWYENTSATITGGTAINGATSASYTLSTDLTEGEYYYFCEISAEGATPVHTAVVTVTVVPEDDILDKITDPEFRAYIAVQTDWDTNGSGIISLEEAAEVTSIDVSSSTPGVRGSIASLAGIEYFTGLTNLSCGDNQLKTLNVSNNTALTNLNCAFNQLEELNVSGCTALTQLWCFNNRLEELNVSNNTALTELSCHDNQLETLDVSNNTLLTTLWCHSNQLEELNVSNNIALTELFCYNNPGDGVSKFPVTAWFDNGSVPAGFETGFWWLDGTEITVEYINANN